MSSDAPQWEDVSEKLRRMMGLCPPSPEEADESIRGAGEIPMSADELHDVVRDATSAPLGPVSFHPDHSWTADLDTSAVAEDSMLVMNRKPGEKDEEVDKRVAELRREALEDDDTHDEQA